MRGHGKDPQIIVVIPATSVTNGPQVFLCRRGGTPTRLSQSDDALAFESYAQRTYAEIAGRRSTGGSGPSHSESRWWIGRRSSVVKWVIPMQEARDAVLLARFHTWWLKELPELNYLTGAIVACAELAGLPLLFADACAVLEQARRDAYPRRNEGQVSAQ